ncbi:bestrophin family protein [Caulobacter sp. FWC2]|uniref:bestrophin family protein n=1 Tax=Caulobacter sp. FWC2 TaxID=69664 RepID=UPI000C147854|nr:bestrophin family protein [Caulobacter sp. FWC2]PIB89890.1 bestrophin [Caulobacter sp. FWC2]
MIVRDRPGLGEVLTAMHGSIVPKIAGRLLILAAISVGAVLLHRTLPEPMGHLGAMPFTLIGLALSIFMSFRNNACYDRWWEARKLWGRLIIAARSFARQTAVLDAEVREPLLLGLCGFAHGLAARLRDQDESAAIRPWIAADDEPEPPNPSDAVLAEVGAQCARLAAQKALSDIHYAVLDSQLSDLSQVQAGCERIKTTPLPFAYSLLLHRTALLFCLLLPFALAPALGWWTPLLVLIASYTFFGLDALGDQLEDPFGTDDNDLPLDALVRTVERELLHAIGRSDLPPPLAPLRYRLT